MNLENPVVPRRKCCKNDGNMLKQHRRQPEEASSDQIEIIWDLVKWQIIINLTKNYEYIVLSREFWLEGYIHIHTYRMAG